MFIGNKILQVCIILSEILQISKFDFLGFQKLTDLSMWFVPIILPVLICSFFRFTLAIIQVFLSVLKFDNLNMVSMHYKLRLWCSSLYLKLVCATLDPLKVLVARGFPLTPFPGFRTPGILFTGCPYPVLCFLFRSLNILFFLSVIFKFIRDVL